MSKIIFDDELLGSSPSEIDDDNLDFEVELEDESDMLEKELKRLKLPSLSNLDNKKLESLKNQKKTPKNLDSENLKYLNLILIILKLKRRKK